MKLLFNRLEKNLSGISLNKHRHTVNSLYRPLQCSREHPVGLHRKENPAFYYLITSLNVRGFHYLIKCFPGVGKGGLEELLLTCLVSNLWAFKQKYLILCLFVVFKEQDFGARLVHFVMSSWWHVLRIIFLKCKWHREPYIINVHLSIAITVSECPGSKSWHTREAVLDPAGFQSYLL